MEQKRLFFGLEVHAPWPDELPKGRILDETCRHMTIAFLGQTDFVEMEKALVEISKMPWKVGFVGQFNKCLFLPERHPHVVAWHIKWLENVAPLIAYQKYLGKFLQQKGLMREEKRDFLHHVTLCRAPFLVNQWRQSFTVLPMYATTLHLYESLGQLQYVSCWSHKIEPPFEEIEHTADIGFIIRGESLLQLYLHAYAALAFKFPPFLDYFYDTNEFINVDDIVISLNKIISKTDAEIGCPLKAVSFHGDLKENNGILEWEMIVDV